MLPEDMVGRVLGHYRIVRQVGYGGMSTVFLAEDINLGRDVAVKVFWPRPGETKDFLRRFSREARVLAQLDHPNILPVYDYGEQDGLAFLVMPFMPGGSLKDKLKERHKLPPSEAIHLTIEMLNALQYAHERGLIHRDIKPGNMLFKSDGKLMLCDFGLVKVISPDTEGKSAFETTSETGPAITGTPEYMPPEQINGHPAFASDIYSIGIVLYEMLTGVRPFTSTNVMSVLMKQIHEQPRPPREINPTISPQLQIIVLRAIEKDPLRRYQRPIDFLQELKQIEIPGDEVGIATSTMPTTPTNLPVPNVQKSQGYSSTPHSAYSAIDEANSETVASDHLPHTQKVGQPISQPDAPNQVGNKDSRANIIAPGTYPQRTFKPVSHSGSIQGASVPPPTRRSRLPALILTILVVILASLVFTLVVTPLGRALLGGSNSSTGQNQPGTTIHTGSTTGNKGSNITPVTTTQGMPSTSTSCPAAGTARAFVSAPLVLGQDPTIVYIVNESNANGPTFGTIKSYDITNSKKVEISKTANTHVDDAQVSADGQLVLFTAHVSGQSELRVVRMDGQGLQTLFCASPGTHITGAQWSFNQKLVVFDVEQDSGGTTIYLLNMTNGSLESELTETAPGLAYLPRTWLDNKRVLLVGFAQNAGAPPQNVYLLDTTRGANQQATDLQQVVSIGQPCWDFDSSFDSTKLFVNQCNPAQNQGSSSVGVQSATGGTLNTFFTSSTLSINAVRVIDPNNTLLAIANNVGQGVSGSTNNDGLYLLKPNGSNPTLLTSNNSGETSTLNLFSQYFWSNVSRDNKLYAIEMSSFSTNRYTLMFGSLHGGTQTTFADISDGTVMEIAGWTRM
ncbi:MAG: protein kinase domain-containing protein [Ktedonobacteraceae bacterium]